METLIATLVTFTTTPKAGCNSQHVSGQEEVSELAGSGSPSRKHYAMRRALIP